MPKSFLLKRRSLPGSMNTSVKITDSQEREADEKSTALKIVQDDPEYKPFLHEPGIHPLNATQYQENNLNAARALALNDQFMAFASSNQFSIFSPYYHLGARPGAMASSFRDFKNRGDFSDIYTRRNGEHYNWRQEISVPRAASYDVLKGEISFAAPPKLVIPGEVKQPYQCDQCGKIFKTKYTLAIHLKMPNHTFARPFVCNTCGKGFRLSSTLCRHKIIHTKEKPYKCHVCEKAFNRSSTLKTHVRTHSDEKEFICERCGKGFHQKGNLRNHILIHTGEKPYKCTLCQKAFNKLSNLKFHMHVHTDNSPYRCKFCKVSFSRRCDLKSHIQNAHSESEGK